MKKVTEEKSSDEKKERGVPEINCPKCGQKMKFESGTYSCNCMETINKMPFGRIEISEFKDNGAYLGSLSDKIGHCRELGLAHGSLVCKREHGWVIVQECCPRLKGELCIFYHEASGGKPIFTPEQMEFLKEILTLPCCHTTGMHDPTHYYEGRYICEGQKTAAWLRACKALGIDLTEPRIKSESDCYWCNNHPEYKDVQLRKDERRGEGRRDW